MCTLAKSFKVWPRSVSIPFKRESTCALVVIGLYLLLHSKVSIPFKRESTCAHYRRIRNPVAVFGFHSLQTGKHMCTKYRHKEETWIQTVSIPFKRESTCARIYPSCNWDLQEVVSIPFKRESTCAHKELSKEQLSVLFPFPSNGKAHVHKIDASEINNSRDFSFHSLQTGKHMCTYPIFDPRHAWLRNPKFKHELRGAFFC